MHTRLRKAEPQEYNKLISQYKTVFNRKTDTTSKMSNQKPVELMTELLEVIIIQ